MTGRDSCLKPRLTKRRGTARNLKRLRERLIGGLDAIESVSDSHESSDYRRGRLSADHVRHHGRGTRRMEDDK